MNFSYHPLKFKFLEKKLFNTIFQARYVYILYLFLHKKYLK